MSGGGGKGGGDIKVYDMLMSLNYGLCHGPVCINAIYVKDKPIWCGHLCEEDTIEVRLPELFGGDQGEGGPVGSIDFQIGTFDQVMLWELAKRLGVDQFDAPGYRGVAHLLFRGDSESGGQGFRWTTNNPYTPETKVSVTRIGTPFLPEYAEIPATAGVDVDGNPLTSLETAGSAAPENRVVTGTWPSQNNFGVWDNDPEVFRFGRTLNSPFGEQIEDDFGLAEEFILEREAAGETYVLSWVWEARVGIDANTPVLPQIELEIIADQTAPSEITSDVIDHVTQNITLGPDDGEDLGDLGRRWSGKLAIPVLANRVRIRGKLGSPNDTIGGSFYNRRSFSFTMGNVDAIEPRLYSVPAYEQLTNDTSQTPHAVFDLYEVGFNQAAIDARQVTVINTLVTNTSPDGSARSDNAFIRFFAAIPEGEPNAGEIDYSNEVFVQNEFESTEQNSLTDPTRITVRTKVAPAGARYVTLVGESIPFLSLFVDYDILQASVRFEGPILSDADGDTSHCTVNGPDLSRLPDMNPAHIIYEAWTNPYWGGSAPAEALDLTSFEEAAITLYNERFGLSIKWVEQETLKDFIQIILDHIKAVFFLSPITGKWTLKLLRDDYDVATLEGLSQENATLVEYKFRSWSEIQNIINVSYTDPANEETATVTAYAPGSYSIQGQTVPETLPFPGIRNPYLGQKVADREVQERSYPLFSGTLEVQRNFWAYTPGRVLTLTWPPIGLQNVVVRVLTVDTGSPSDRTMKLGVVEDIYGLNQTRFIKPQVNAVADPPPPVPYDPVPVPPSDPEVPYDPPPGIGGGSEPAPGGSLPPDDVEAPAEPVSPGDAVQFALTAPLPAMRQAGYDVEEVAGNVGQAHVMFLIGGGTQPIVDIKVDGPVGNLSGTPNIQAVATFPPVKTRLLDSALVRESTSTIPATTVEQLLTSEDRQSGALLMIGNAEGLSEIVMLSGSGGSTWNIRRGIWDTVPLDWPAGSRIWAFRPGIGQEDPYERVASETLTYYPRPRVGSQRLPRTSVPPLSYEVSLRPHLPFRPANAELDGTGFVGVEYTDPATLPSEVTATWANRNRLTEDSVTRVWNAASVAPEPGQTTVLIVRDFNGTEQDRISGLTGTSHAIPISTLSAVGIGFVDFRSELDGDLSLTGARIPFNVVGAGWGNGWGFNWNN